MHGIDRVCLSLKPVAGDFRKEDLGESVLPSKRLPVWNEGSRFGPEVGPDQAGMRLDRIGLDANLIFEAYVLRADIIVRVLDTSIHFLEQPAVIITSQTALFNETIREIGTAMRTLPVDETEL